MRHDHRKPLFAFVAVALACGLIVANGLRSDAAVDDGPDGYATHATHPHSLG